MSHHLSRAARPATADSRRIASRLALLASLLIGLLGLAPASVLAANATVTQSDLCNAWTVGTSNPEVTLASGFKITGDKLTRTGSSCTADGAYVSIPGATIAEVGTTSGGNAASRALASVIRTAVAEGDVKEGDEVFKGAKITSLTANLYNGFIGIKGGLEIQWSAGTASKFDFEGRFYALDRFSMVLKSPAAGTTLPSVGGAPINFTGDLVRDSAGFHLNVNGTASLITYGTGDKQLSVSNAKLTMTMADVLKGEGLLVKATGEIGVGPNVKVVDGVVNAEFDTAGLVKATGSGALQAAIPASGNNPAGTVTGDATIAYDRSGAQNLQFKGQVKFGDALVANAKGDFDAQAVNFSGDLTLATADLGVTGAVDGVAFYGDNLTGRTVVGRGGQQVQVTKGDGLIKSINAKVSAKNLNVTGLAQVGSVGGDVWATATGTVDATFTVPGLPETTLKGSADVAWVKGSSPTVKFKGDAGSGSTVVANLEGTVDGSKLSLKGDATLSNPDLTIKGAAEGDLYYADGSSDQLSTRAGTKVAAKKGDFVIKSASAKVDTNGFSLTGAATMSRVGGDRWASASGTADGKYGDAIVSGSAELKWVAGDVPTATFSGSFKSGTTTVANVKGAVDGTQLSIKGDGSFVVNGAAVKGAVDGTVAFADGGTITDDTGKAVAAKRGDWVIRSLSGDVIAPGLTAAGTTSLGSIGGRLWVNASGSVDVTYGYTHVKGNATLTYDGNNSPVLKFNGSLESGTLSIENVSGTIDNKKIELSGEAEFVANGVTLLADADGVFYYADPAGATLPNADGVQVPAQKGDVLIRSVNTKFAMKGVLVKGTARIGSVQGKLYANGSGSVNATSSGITMAGSAGFAWAQNQALTATFAGTVTNGTTIVANASGTLDGRALTLKGDASMKGDDYVATGAVQGTYYYATPPAGTKLDGPGGTQLAAVKGDFLVKTASGKVEAKNLTVGGDLTGGKVGGKFWIKGTGTVDASFGTPATAVKGSATFTWATGTTGALSFDGSATNGSIVVTGKGTVDGKKITLDGTASYTAADLTVKGAIDGAVVYYADPAGDTLPDSSGKQVAAAKGDFLVKSASATAKVKTINVAGGVSLAKVGGNVWVKGGGNVDYTQGDVNLKGSLSFDWSTGKPVSANYEGKVTAGTYLVGEANGTIDERKITLRGNATVTQPSFKLTGDVDAGVVYFGDPAGEKIIDSTGAQVAAAKGDFYVKSATGTLVSGATTINGNVSAGSINGKIWAAGGGSINTSFGDPATTIKGSANFAFSAANADGALQFDGTVTSGALVLTGKGTMDGKKIALQGTAAYGSGDLAAKGAVTGTVYYADPAGATIADATGKQVAAAKGDFVVSSASGTITAKGLTVSGDVSLGKVNGALWAKGTGSVDYTQGDLNLKGSATVTWNGTGTPTVDYTGKVTAGTYFVGEASGTVDGKKITLKGNATVTQPSFKLTGAVDGGVYYYADPAGDKITDSTGAQVAAAKGDFYVKSGTGTLTSGATTLTGNVSAGSIASKIWAAGNGTLDTSFGTPATTIKGSANFVFSAANSDGVLTFDGAVTSGALTIKGKGAMDGKKIALSGTAEYSTADLSVKGSIDSGVVYYADPAGATITDASGKTVAATKGDVLVKASITGSVKNLAASGNATLGKVGDTLFVKGSGAVDYTQGDINLKGTAAFDWSTGKTLAADYTGKVSAGDYFVGEASGTVDGKKITLGGTAKLTQPTFTVNGSASGGVYYYGDPAGDKITDASGAQVAAAKGDFYVKSATGTIVSGATTVTGNVSAGSIAGKIWAKGGGTLDTSFGNPATTIKGSADFTFAAGATSSGLEFDGTVTSGALTLTGKGTMDGKKIALKGTASYANTDLSVKGNVEGTVYYGDPAGDTLPDASGKQVAAAKGDFVVKSLGGTVTAKNLVVSGDVSLGKVGGALYAKGTGSVDYTQGDINLKGSATVAWAGSGAPTVDFTGKVTAGTYFVGDASGTVDGKKVTIKGNAKFTSSAFNVSGAADGGVYYYADPAGDKITDASGAQVAAAKGDFYVKSIGGSVTAQGLTVTGDASVGSIAGKLWAKASGSVDYTTGDLNLKGSANVAWAGSGFPTVNYTGKVIAGSYFAGEASGTVDGKKVTLSGNATVTQPTFKVTGAVDGGVYYYADPAGDKITDGTGAQVAAAKGDFYVKSAGGTLTSGATTLTGNVSAGSVGGKIWAAGNGTLDTTFGTPATTIKGSANFVFSAANTNGVLTFDGAVTSGALAITGKGTMDGKKITLSGTASYAQTDLSVKGAIDSGVVYYADPAGDKITNAAGVQVAAAKGDVLVKASATGNVKGVAIAGDVTLGKVGDTLFAKGGGAVDYTQGDITLKGTAAFDWSTGKTLSADYTGKVTAGNYLVADASGTLDTKKITLKGNAKLTQPGIVVNGSADGGVYYFGDPAGDKITDASGNQVAAAKGDFFIKSIGGTVTAQGLTVSGDASVGSVGGKLWAKATGTVDYTTGDINLKGSATVAWAGSGTPTVNYTGKVTAGTSFVGEASGTVDGKKVTISGNAKVTQPSFTLSGAVDGGVYYYADPAGDKITDGTGAQVAAAKGDFYVKSAGGTLVSGATTVNGNVSAGSVGGKIWAAGGGSIDTSFGTPATTIKGSANFVYNANGTSGLAFDGTVTSGALTLTGKGKMDGKKIELSGTAAYSTADLAVKGNVDGIVYYGDPAGDTLPDASGKQVAAAKGDFVVKSLGGTVTAKNLVVSGDVSVGKVAGGALYVKGTGSVDYTQGDINLKGSATVAWAGSGFPTVDYTGKVTAGTYFVGEASGTVDGKKVTLKGNATVTQPTFKVTGAVDGGVYYYADPAGDKITDASGAQVAAAKGDFYVKSATGTLVSGATTVNGNVSAGSVGGKIWAAGNGSIDTSFGTPATTIKGSANFTFAAGATSGGLEFAGTVTSGAITLTGKGTMDGKKIALTGTASYATGDLAIKGNVEGTVYYGDPAGDKLTDASGAQVAAAKGDFFVKSLGGSITAKGLTISGDASIGKVNGGLWAKGTGSVDATFGDTNLKGSASVAWNGSGTPTVDFTGKVTSGGSFVGEASGTVDGKKVTIKGSASFTQPTFKVTGAVDGGVYYYADPAGDKITNQSGAQVAAAKGDFYVKSAGGTIVTGTTTITGNVSVGSAGGKLWATGGGTLDTSFGTPVTTVKGSANFSWVDGGASALTFDGTVTAGSTVVTAKGAMDGKKIDLQGTVAYTTSGLVIKGAADGTVYYGDPAGATITDASGKQVTASKGDIYVKSATASVTTKGLGISGSASLGKIGSTLWAKGAGSVEFAFGPQTIKGSATFDWTGSLGNNPNVEITGDATGTAFTGKVSGSVDGKKLSITGDGSVTGSTFKLTGGLDGYIYYADPAGATITNQAGQQVAASQGDFYVKSATGTLVTGGNTIKGNVTAGSIGGKLWANGGGSVDLSFGSPVTTIKGTSQFQWAQDGTASLQFEGTVTQGDYVLKGSGTMDGKKIVFKGSLSSPTLSGNGSGVVYYGEDLSGETITNRSGTKVAASRGDFELKVTDGKAVMKQITAQANFTVRKQGATIWANADAQIKVGTTFLTFTGELDNAGNVNLKGAGTAVLDGYTVYFNGSAVIKNNALTLTGQVDIVTGLFSVRLTGTIYKADMNTSTYEFIGSGAFRFGGYDVASATIRFITGEGITTAFDVKSCLLFLCTTGKYKIYFTGKDISRIQLSAPIASWAAFFAIAKIAAPSVPVETQITGIL